MPLREVGQWHKFGGLVFKTKILSGVNPALHNIHANFLAAALADNPIEFVWILSAVPNRQYLDKSFCLSICK